MSLGCLQDSVCEIHLPGVHCQCLPSPGAASLARAASGCVLHALALSRNCCSRLALRCRERCATFLCSARYVAFALASSEDRGAAVCFKDAHIRSFSKSNRTNCKEQVVSNREVCFRLASPKPPETFDS